jgi:methionyl-tRNA formyltransferase
MVSESGGLVYAQRMDTGPPKRVVLLGKGDLCVRVGEWFLQAAEYDLVAVVPVVPEPGWSASMIEWATTNGVPYAASGHYDELVDADEGDWHIDLAFVVFYDRILPARFISRCGRILNLHNSPLPRYRGMAPINWALKEDQRMHGVTIHEITPGIDDGPIVAQLTYSIYPEFDEVIDVYRRSLTFGWTLFEQTMPLLDAIEARPQDDSLATYFTAEDQARLGDRRDFTRAQSVS